MSKCQICKDFIEKRKKIFEQLEGSKNILWLYYNNPETTDEIFEEILPICNQCYNETCRQLGQDCDPDIKKFTETQGPGELKLRKKRQLEEIKSSLSCKKCEVYDKKLKNFQLSNLTPEQLEEWYVSCFECWNRCNQKNINDEYCRRSRDLSDLANKKKKEAREKNIEKLANIEKIKRQLKK